MEASGPTQFGHVVAIAASLQVSPVASGSTQSEFRMGIVRDMSEYFAMRATPTSLGLYGPSGVESVSFAASGSSAFAFPVSVTSSVSVNASGGTDAVVRATASGSCVDTCLVCFMNILVLMSVTMFVWSW